MSMEIKSSNEIAKTHAESMLNNRGELRDVVEEVMMIEKNFTIGREIYESTSKIVVDYGKIVGRDALNIMRIANSIEEQDEDMSSSIRNI